jgi:S-DNA-T family DNA segregation ATPase FtsK/SpoIIIE
MLAMALTLTHATLDQQAERIEQVLASHRVPVKVHSGSVSPRWVRFMLTPGLGAKIATVRNLSEELAMALGADEVRVARDGEALAVEVPRTDPQPVRLFSLMASLTEIPVLTACLGLADDGRPLLLRLPSADVAHVLIAGMTGSGKTELMRTMLVSLALMNRQSKLQMALIDPKSRGFTSLAGLPHLLDDVASDPASALSLLDRLIKEMERRDERGMSSPHIVIAIDELLDLFGAEEIAGRRVTRSGHTLEQALTRIAQRGREAGLHLVVGVQKPSASVIGSMLKANFPVRIVGRVGSAEDARVATGQGGTGAEKLMGHGDFIALAAGQLLRFQAAYIPAHDWARFAGSAPEE